MIARFVLILSAAALAATATAQDVRTGKTSSGIAYDVRGSGPVVVLITGSNLDRRMWDREAGWLALSNTVVRYDLRAHGASDSPKQPFSHLDDLIAVLDALNIGKATLIGLSAGSAIAIDAAIAIPQRIERIIVAGPAPSGYVPKQMPPFAADMMAALKAGDYKRVSEVLLATSVFAAPPESRALVRDMVMQNDRMWTIDRSLMKAAPSAIDKLGAITTPTLVLIGDKDEFQREPAELLAAKILGARIVRIAGGGHLLNLTSPKEFDEAVSAFLKEGRIAAFEAASLARRNATPSDRARAELRWLRALRGVVTADPFGARADAAWEKGHDELVFYDEIGGRWLIAGEQLDKSYDAFAKSDVADEIAWIAVENGLGGECEGYIPCYLSGLDRLYGMYLRRQPRGAHRQAAVDRIAESLRNSVGLLNDKNAKDYFNPASDCADLMAGARPLRKALIGSGVPTSSDATGLLDRLMARCPGK